jgi:hypothetical protein
MKNMNINEENCPICNSHVNLLSHLTKEHRMDINVATALQHLQRRVELLESTARV